MQDLGIKVLFEGSNFTRLLSGLWVTVEISLVSVAISLVLGVLLGMVMTLKNPITKVLTKIFLEFNRLMPQLVSLFLVYFGLTTAFGIDLSGQTSAIIVFSLWGTAEMGDLVRSALISIPKHQYDSSAALGLTKLQAYRYVVIPQTLRRLTPPAINLTTRMIKTTSLVVLIGVVEVLKVGQQIIDANRYTTPDAALWIYGVIFFLYFIVCYPISKLAGRLEKQWKN
ncbi:MAG: amino acid ABC transporter permease [Coriobacteriia bacterium]|nr:amino acid ABC transporter permease [Coriobacteriia bacterium]